MVISKRARLATNILLSFGTSLCLFAAGEVAFRVRHKFYRGIGFFDSLEPYKSNPLGWPGKEILGDATTKRQRLLILGDSFSEGMGLPEEKLYYRVLAERLNVELFVYAGRGYGTLQEYLAAKNLIEKAKPTLVLLQVCSNDFINNSFELERKSYRQNALAIRPYLENDQIVYRYPSRFGSLRVFLGGHSRLFHFIFSKYDLALFQLNERGVLSSVEEDIHEKGKAFPPFAMSVKTTAEILELLKKQLGPIPIVAVTADISPVENTEFRAIFKQLGIEFIEEAAKKVRKARKSGARVFLADGTHWNEQGHEIVGAVLAKRLESIIQISAVVAARN